MKLSFSRWAAIVAIAVGLAACDNDDDVAVAATDFLISSFDLRVIHASPDAPDVNIEFDGSEIATDLSYKQSSPVTTLFDADSGSVAVVAQLPGGNAPVIGPANISFADGTRTDVIAVGKVGDGTLDALIVSSSNEPVIARNVRVQVVHGAPNVPIPVDVYVTAPNDDILPLMPTGTFDFGESIGPVEVPAGDYRIRVVLPADMTKTPVFDSGTVALPGGTDFTIVAVENTNVGAGAPGQSPISLFATAEGVGDLEIVDVATPAAYRAAHFSPDTDPVNVLINDTVALANVPYPAVSDFSEADAGTYNVKIELVANPGAYAIDEDVTLVAGKRYSVYAADYTAGLIADGLFILEDDFRPLATGAKVRIVHLAPGAGLVDIYVTPAGTGITGATPAFAGVDFKDDTGYVQLDAGMYDVDVTLAGTQTVAISATIDVALGGVYTALARDAAGGGGPFDVELLVEL